MTGASVFLVRCISSPKILSGDPLQKSASPDADELDGSTGVPSPAGEEPGGSVLPSPEDDDENQEEANLLAGLVPGQADGELEPELPPPAASSGRIVVLGGSVLIEMSMEILSSCRVV